ALLPIVRTLVRWSRSTPALLQTCLFTSAARQVPINFFQEQGIAAASSSSVPSSTSAASSGSPSSSSPADQLFADYIVLLNDAQNAYQTGTFSMPALWQSIDALALQRLDLLL